MRHGVGLVALALFACGEGPAADVDASRDASHADASGEDAGRPESDAGDSDGAIADGGAEDSDSGVDASTPPACGNGRVEAGEECDQGAGNSDVEPDACRSSCSRAACGDGVRDSGEACDDGEANSDDTPNACRSTCDAAGCGDGVLDDGEVCDEGGGNSDVEPDACRSSCSRAACGDGILDSGEACDDGEANSDDTPNACRSTCEPPRCSDGVTDDGEECDQGAGNSDVQPDACRISCLRAACGDGVLDTGEACDDGEANSDEMPNACRSTCEAAGCGDGVLDDAEACDDGNAADRDGCATDCTIPSCGDGIVSRGELCLQDPRVAVNGAPVDAIVADLDSDARLDLAVVCLDSQDVKVLIGDGAGGFTTAGSYAVDGPSFDLASGDLDGDGDTDIVVANYTRSAASVILNQGAAVFGPPTHFAAGRARAVTLADLDMDGDLDIATADMSGDSVSFLLNEGAGAFAAATTLPAGDSPLAIAAGDFDEDGDPDIVVPHGISRAPGVFWNDGSGTLGAMQILAETTWMHDVEVADVTGDTHLDLVLATNTGVEVRAGNGAGGFGEPSSVVVEYDTQGRIVVEDFDADGALDVAVARLEFAAVLMNLRGGALGEPRYFYAGNRIDSLVPTDLESNGLVDLIGVGRDSNDVSLLFSQGGGSFRAPVRVGTSEIAEAIAGDLDGDAALDIVSFPSTYSDVYPDEVTVHLNDGAGGFRPGTTVPVADAPRTGAILDLEQDGDMDVIVANLDSSDLSVLENDGDASFMVASTIPLGHAPEHGQVVAADVDGDGDQDLAILLKVSWDAHEVNVFLNDGGGEFDPPVAYQVGRLSADLRGGDLDGDGDVDLVSVNNDGVLWTLENDGNGVFAVDSVLLGGYVVGLALGDLDTDGDLDVSLQEAWLGDPLRIWRALNLGDDSFGASDIVFASPSCAFGIELSDLNTDDVSDLIVNEMCTSQVSIRLGDGAGGFLEQIARRAMGPDGRPTVADFNGDRAADLLVVDSDGILVSFANP